MAILGKLRDRAGLLISIAIGLALLLFVISDLFGPKGSSFGRKQYEVARIGRKSISYEEYERKFKENEEFYKIYKRISTGLSNINEQDLTFLHNNLWEQLLQDYVFGEEYKKIGLNVSGSELRDIILSNNPPVYVRILFSDESGNVNKNALVNFLQTVLKDEEDTEEKRLWLFVEKQIQRERALRKYFNLITKGIYVNSAQAQFNALTSLKTMNIDFIVKKYSEISDSLVKVKTSELKEYYEKNKELYKQNEGRDIKYIYFEVVPSESDIKKAEEWINSVKNEFITSTDPKQFINLQSDEPYYDLNYSYNELPENIRDLMFNGKPGDYYGPYKNGDTFKIAMLIDVVYIPDSVKARHILLQPDQKHPKLEDLKNLADSLKKEILKGANFEELVKQFSTDRGTKEKGGDLGWFKERTMIKAFSDSCFMAKKGDVKIVETQFGIHVVQITDQSPKTKKVKVGFLVKLIEPSNETDNYYYNKASTFASKYNTYEKFNEGIKKENLFPLYAYNIRSMDYMVNNLRSAREIIRWAYNAEEHDVSPVFKIENKYIVATLEKVRQKGYAPFEEVKAEIMLEVIKEKKAKMIEEEFYNKIKNSKTITEIARSLNRNIQSANNIRYNASILPEIGFEPKVAATAFAMNKGDVSKPIKGNNGVYIISLSDVTNPEINQAYVERSKGMLKQTYYQPLIENQLYYDIIDKVKVEDKRWKFY